MADYDDLIIEGGDFIPTYEGITSDDDFLPYIEGDDFSDFDFGGLDDLQPNYDDLSPDPDQEPNPEPDEGNEDVIETDISPDAIIDFGSEMSKRVHSLVIVYEKEKFFSGTISSATNKITKFVRNGFNTWDTWRLIPSSRPVINPPQFKSNYVDIPGTDGSLDISDLITGGLPTYANRTGSIEFYVTRDYDEYYSWSNVYQRIMASIHGRKLKVVLLDDPAYYYAGRMTVNQWRSEKDWSKITLDYQFEPYKYETRMMSDKWKWDPFNFVNGVVPPDAEVSYLGSDGMGFAIKQGSTKTFDIYADIMPTVPTLVIRSDTDDQEITITAKQVDPVTGSFIKDVYSYSIAISKYSSSHNYKIFKAGIVNGRFTITITGKKISNNANVRIGLTYGRGSL